MEAVAPAILVIDVVAAPLCHWYVTAPVPPEVVAVIAVGVAPEQTLCADATLTVGSATTVRTWLPVAVASGQEADFARRV